MWQKIVSFVVSLLLCACTTTFPSKSVEESSESRVRIYKEWKLRSTERRIDAQSLKSELLMVGGTNVEVDALFSNLPKSALLFSENPGVLSGRYRNGIAARWRSKFESWCERTGGFVADRNRSETVVAYASAVSGEKDSYSSDAESGSATCFESAAENDLGIWDAMASITLVRDNTSSGKNSRGYLIVQTQMDIAASRSVVEAAQVAKGQAEARKQQAEAQVLDDARADWESASKVLRSRLVVGDSVSVVVGLGNMNKIADGIVVEVKRPIAKIQFLDMQPALQWVKIDDLFTPHIPKALLCSASRAMNRGCLR